MITIFCNGVWDIFHYGHYNLLKRAKLYGDYLIVGVASDESCTKYKRQPHQSWKIRANSVRNLSFVNEVIETPWSIDLTEDFYKKYDIDYQVQGDDSSSFPLAKKLGILMPIGRTEGISTTKIENVLEGKSLTGGFINEIKEVFADNKLYVIKTSNTKKSGYNISRERIYTEYDSIMAFREILPNRNIIINPICFDPGSYTIVFERAPKQAELLTTVMLNGSIDKNIINNIVRELGVMHDYTKYNAKLEKKFHDSKGFYELKVKVQCRDITKDIGLQKKIDGFVDKSVENRIALLHGDFAPKNILVWKENFLFIDFEESIFSDPALDIGYFLAHLHLLDYKFVEEAYDSYMSAVDFKDGFKDRVNTFTGIFMLSRIDGQAKATWKLDETKMRKKAMEILEGCGW